MMNQLPDIGRGYRKVHEGIQGVRPRRRSHLTVGGGGKQKIA